MRLVPGGIKSGDGVDRGSRGDIEVDVYTVEMIKSKTVEYSKLFFFGFRS